MFNLLFEQLLFFNVTFHYYSPYYFTNTLSYIIISSGSTACACDNTYIASMAIIYNKCNYRHNNLSG